MSDTATDFPAQLDRLLLYVRCGERIGAAMEQNTHTLAALNAVVTHVYRGCALGLIYSMVMLEFGSRHALFVTGSVFAVFYLLLAWFMKRKASRGR